MGIPRIHIGSGLLLDLERSIRFEWIITNGLGGYASSTVLGVNTRKYHGLLVAAFNPPTDRRVILTKLDEELRIGDESYFLGSNEFRGVIHPEGYKHMRSFSLEPFPTFRYETRRVYLRKTLFMPQFKNMVVSCYDAHNTLDEPVEIRIFPLVNSRHFYDVTNRNEQKPTFLQEPFEEGVHLWTTSPASHLIIWSPQGHYSSKENERRWIDKIYFRVDDMRGEACLDDNYQPGFFIISVKPEERKSFQVVAVADKDEADAKSTFSSVRKEESIELLYNEELSRKKNLLRSLVGENQHEKAEDWLKLLVLSTDLFIVQKRSTGKKSIIAGYHWFEDWGRDSLISLSGLTLVTGRFREAKDVLLTFSNYCKSGLVPNRFPDRTGDQPVYNAVDVSLWLFHAVFQYLKYSGDFDLVYKELWRTLCSIIQNYEQGTLFNIHMDDDGLIEHGPQLTWMDAAINEKPVTPREGKSVEVQVLWYNALRIIQVLAKNGGHKKEAEEYGLLAEKAY
ncbi:MAG: amylo-alpha-1,6-glucosidase, partial [Nitrososphaerota archaeon]